jgi:predicted RNA-binding protein with PUA-like domain
MVIDGVISDILQKPNEENEKLVVFDITPDEALNNQVTLSEIKGDNRFSDFHLVKFSRLSVMPVDKERWELIMELSK